ncbi:hypothetical protein SAY86_014244 [Trapa natans]|uniref:Uncharacterized protein n=1 Tax=Trapa natans TaxID=22666 RepID=A0AAN7KW40_TRANT|nr:hypothetical protein SAY86_014244 [Trapa natans]
MVPHPLVAMCRAPLILLWTLAKSTNRTYPVADELSSSYSDSSESFRSQKERVMCENMVVDEGNSVAEEEVKKPLVSHQREERSLNPLKAEEEEVSRAEQEVQVQEEPYCTNYKV